MTQDQSLRIDEAYSCPVCEQPMALKKGSVLRTDGITLFCPNTSCSSQEVFGYGTNPEAAHKIVREKYAQHMD